MKYRSRILKPGNGRAQASASLKEPKSYHFRVRPTIQKVSASNFPERMGMGAWADRAPACFLAR